MTVNNDARINWQTLVHQVLTTYPRSTAEERAKRIFSQWWQTTADDKDIEQILAEVIRFYELGAVERGLQPSGGVAEHGHSEPRKALGESNRPIIAPTPSGGFHSKDKFYGDY